jgi:hypothetical protein
MEDYGDILGDLDMHDQIRIGFDLNQEIREMQENDLILFGSRRKMKIKLQYEAETKPPLDWNVATIATVRPDNPSIVGDFIIAGFAKKTSFD